jgi:NAD(P)H dehydrogenase (quinone)
MDDQKEVIVDTKTSLMQQKITWADELIFVFPIWWGSMPAVMKNWIDVNFLGGFAFRYLE